MRAIISICVVLLFSTFSFVANANSTPEKPALVLISIDGFRHDYIELHDAKNMAAIASQGTRAKGLMPVYPSKTFPNHLSIVTGQYPSHHGIVDNNFYDTERKQRYHMGDGVKDSSWLTTLPIWNLAEFQGVKAATFFWPESAARINGATPTYYYNYSTPTPNQQRVDQIIDWLKLPKASRPMLVTGYFSIVDSMGHRFGPESARTKGAVQHIDKLMGQLWERLNTEVDIPVNLIIVSDHGMTEITADAMIDVNELDIDDELFEVVNSQTRLLIYPKENTSDAEIAALKEELAEEQQDVGFSIESEADLTAMGVSQGPRKPALVLGTQAPASFATRPKEQWKDGGTHGYHSNGDMNGIFIASGPSIKKGVPLDRFRNIHVYPFMANLMGLELMSKIDGDADVLAPLIKKN